MATLDELTQREDIPRLVSMNFDLLKVEMRAMERRIKTDFKSEIDAGIRVIAELIVEHNT